jgi:hypothetical protein
MVRCGRGAPNPTVQPNGASRSAQRQIERRRRLAPVADLAVGREQSRAQFPSNRRMKTFLMSLAVVFAMASGCAHSTAKNRTAAPSTLGQRIFEADRIVITQRWASTDPRLRGFTHTLSGDEVRKVVNDVAFMTPAQGVLTDSIFSWELQFYKGAEPLAAIYLAGATFTFEDKEYFGDTRELSRLLRRLLRLSGLD